MDILVVDQFAAPPEKFGFPRHYYLGRELVRRGHTVTIAASNFNHKTREHLFDDANSIQNGHEETVDGVRFIWLPATKYTGNDYRRVFGMFTFPYRVFKEKWGIRIGNIDVVLGSSPNLLTAYGALRLAKKLGAPFALEVRDAHPGSLIELGGFSPNHPAILGMRYVERLLYRKSDAIVSVLPNLFEHVSKSGAASDKMFHVSNGVDISRFKFLPLPNNDTFDLMYAGAMGRANNLERIVEAFNVLAQTRDTRSVKIRLRLIGDGPQKDSLREMAKQLNLLGDTVLVEGSVPQTEIAGKLAEANAFVFQLMDSSLWKAHGISPNKIFDYMASARPTLSIISAANNPVEEAGAGINISGNSTPAEIADAIVALSDMPVEVCQKMGKNAFEAAKNKYGFAALAENLEAALAYANKKSSKS